MAGTERPIGARLDALEREAAWRRAVTRWLAGAIAALAVLACAAAYFGRAARVADAPPAAGPRVADEPPPPAPQPAPPAEAVNGDEDDPHRAAADAALVKAFLTPKRLTVAGSVRCRDGSGRVFLVAHDPGGGPIGEPFAAAFLPTGAGPPVMKGLGRYYWETLAPAELAVYFAEARCNRSMTFRPLEFALNPGGDLDATLLCEQDGRRWRLTVRDYRDRSLKPEPAG